MKDKGEFEEVIRSKLYCYESSTEAEDWDKIAAKLPAGKKVKLFPLKKYLTVVAAIAALLMIGGGVYVSNRQTHKAAAEIRTGDDPTELSREKTNEHRNDMAGKCTDEIVNEHKNECTKLPLTKDHAPPGLTALSTRTENKSTDRMTEHTDECSELLSPEKDSTCLSKALSIETLSPEKHIDHSLTALSLKPNDASGKIKRNKRWAFGFGGLRTGMSSNSGDIRNIAPASSEFLSSPVEPNSGFVSSEYYALKSLKINTDDIPYTDNIEHKMPVSFGLGVSYYLNDRWTLQSGLVYTMLRSKWSDGGSVIEKYDYTQKLHYTGLPLSVSYKLYQWKRAGFFVSAGGMAEFNIGGDLEKITLYDNEKLTDNKGIRMKEPLFSVNSRLGIIYPVWRFINVYAETGLSYYFDNGSSIKTIRSDKPFNVSLQAGIGFGF